MPANTLHTLGLALVQESAVNVHSSSFSLFLAMQAARLFNVYAAKQQGICY
jgi:hypothetical protein